MLPVATGSKALSSMLSRDLPKYFNPDEIQAIISDHTREADYEGYFLSLFLWNTGLRISEALSIRVGDIDLHRKALRAVTLKRIGHTRVIPLKTSLIAEIALWINFKGLAREDRLFPFTRKTGYNHIRRACHIAGIEDGRAHPHTLRHTFAINCVSQGVPITVLQEWLGHRDVTKTLIYSKILAKDSQIFMDQVQF